MIVWFGASPFTTARPPVPKYELTQNFYVDKLISLKWKDKWFFVLEMVFLQFLIKKGNFGEHRMFRVRKITEEITLLIMEL